MATTVQSMPNVRRKRDIPRPPMIHSASSAHDLGLSGRPAPQSARSRKDNATNSELPLETRSASSDSLGLRSRPASWPSRLPHFRDSSSQGNNGSLCLEIPSDRVFGFDITKYKDGDHVFVPASARDKIRYVGRMIHHGVTTTRSTKINTVQFDWPGCSFEIRAKNTRTVAIRLKGDGNYMNIFVNGAFRCILRASLNATCCDVATDLDPEQEYTVTVTKRTEAQTRGALSTFKVCTFYGFILDPSAEVLPCRPPKSRKIEFIGDSDTCAFGNEGLQTHSRRIFGMKGRMENVYNGYTCIMARMFDADAHVIAWTGKGVHSNAADWGLSMLGLWKNALASRPTEGDWDMSSWTPDVVVINLGINDLSPPASSETDIIAAYALLLAEVRSYRPDADIFCVVCDESCISSEEKAIDRSRLSLQLQEIIKLAKSKVSKYDSKIHYTLLKIDGGLAKEDYAAFQHYAVSGHIKIAMALAQDVMLRTKWTIEHEPETMPYPQEKNEILNPDGRSNKATCALQ